MNSTAITAVRALPWGAYMARTAAGLRACWIAAQLLAMAVAIGAAIAYEHRQQIRDAAIAAIAAVVVAAQATYHAGRRTRSLWDQLVAFSERMGRWYSSLLVGTTTAPAARGILDTISKRQAQPVQAATPAAPAPQPIGSNTADIGLSDREARSFSFLRAIRAQASPNDRAAWEAASFEREVSDATAARMGIARDGIHVPHDVLRRDLTASSSTAAGDLIFTDARPGSFIELLRNRLALTTLGVQTLTGLTGPVAIPKQTGAATAYWVAEKGTLTESNPMVGQINMTPKTCGAYTEFSRRLLIQSSMDVETMVRDELTAILALEIDRVALYGTGSSSQPLGLKNVTGINTKDFNANQPTYVELVELETLIAADNADIGAMAYLTNATIYGGMKTTEKASSTAQFVLEPGGTVGGYPIVRSNQVESNDVWFGVWSQMIMGMFGSLTIQVNPYALDTSGGVRVTAFQDVDIAVRYPEAFARGNNTL
jgi:HK97 family phage major capsid protein